MQNPLIHFPADCFCDLAWVCTFFHKVRRRNEWLPNLMFFERDWISSIRYSRQFLGWRWQWSW
jgi:hypothetical protein